MTDKKVVSLNLPVEDVDYLDEVSDNRSAYIRKLLEADRESKSLANNAVAEFRKKQIAQQRAAAKSQLELYDEELEKINETLRTSKKQTSAELSEAREQLSRVPRDPTNPAIENWADKLGMTPAELIEELERDEE